MVIDDQEIVALLRARAERFATKRAASASNRAFIIMSARAMADHGASGDMTLMRAALAKAGIAGLGLAFRAKLLMDLEEDVRMHRAFELEVQAEEEAAAEEKRRAERAARAGRMPQVRVIFDD